ncbi:MAG: hypothetical protein JWN31_224 [Frankiales bacterium]|nr:hypothetical protein [Frankiales bacterium]
MIVFVETAVVLLVPEAQSLLDEVQAQTGAERPGMPAHVTLLYPFAPDPDAGVLAELGFFFSGVDGFPLTFSSSAEFPEVVYLAPDEAGECQELTAALARRWPDFPPYGGLFEEVVPHLTVVNTPDAELRSRAKDAVGTRLPITSRATEASLWVREPSGWRCLEAFPLAPVEPEA